MSKFERRPFAEYGLPWRAMFRKHFWQGTLWGFAASLLMIILLRLLGTASFEGLALHGQTLAKFALLWAAAFLLLGFAEEFAYRGYSQATLTDGMGFWPAAVVLSAIFGAVHYFFKPIENWMDGLSVGLFGLFWCFTLRRTRTLWFAIGFHAMSDYADMVLFAQPNTGNNGQSLTGHLLNVSYQGPGTKGLQSWLKVYPKVFSDSQLARISAPVCLLLGDREVCYNAESAAKRARQVMPRAAIEILPNAGHLLVMECPDAANRRILAFLRE